MIEIVLSASSLWAYWYFRGSYNLAIDEVRFALPFEFASRSFWSLALLTAALMKTGGMTACLLRLPTIGLPLRLIGLAFSGTIWGIFGLSSILSQPSLFAFPVLTLGLSAWWLLLRFPSMPRGPS